MENIEDHGACVTKTPAENKCAIEAALAGQGIALASAVFVNEDIAAGRLVPAFAETMRSQSDFYVVSLRKPRQAQSVAKVRAWLLQHAERSTRA